MRDNKTYFLDLPTLLTYLSGQSCEVTTELSVSGKPARGSLVLKEGTIVSCLLILSNGRQVTGKQAYQQLQNETQWQVQLEPLEGKKPTFSSVQVPPPSAFPPLSAPHGFWLPPPPKPKRPLDPSYLQSLSIKERLTVRSVYMMVNGKNSIEEIKNQLHLSPSSIDEALTMLRMFDVIE